MSNYIRDAFKSLDLLEDTSFDLDTKDGFQELDTFINDDGDIDPEVNVFDLEADEEEELKDSYVGDAILECPVCHAYIFKPMEEVVVDNETELCCVGEECPVCGSEDGFKVIGKVAPFEEEEKSEVEVETEPDSDVEVEVEDKEEIKEALRKRVATKINEKQLKRKQFANKHSLNENIKKTSKKSLKESRSEEIDRMAFASLIKYNDFPGDKSYGVLNDGWFCYKFIADSDEEAREIFRKHGTKADTDGQGWLVKECIKKEAEEESLKEAHSYGCGRVSDSWDEYDDGNHTFTLYINDKKVDSDYDIQSLIGRAEDSDGFAEIWVDDEDLDHAVWTNESLQKPNGKTLKEDVSIKGLENAKDVSDEFSNYASYKANFKPLVIVKLGKEYYAYPTWAKDENDYRQHGTKDYINGWLYGAVQAKMKILESKKLKEAFDVVDYYKHNKEVPDVAYDMAAEIDRRFDDKQLITWDDFNEAFEDAFPGVVDWGEDAFNELETDVRGVLAQYGWGTIFEGENEGGLEHLSESKELVETPVYNLNPRFDSRQSFYGKAKVDTGDKNDENKLYSYDTLVAEIKDGKPVVYGTYSQTTLRHIKDWLKQNGFKAESGKQIMADYGVKDESLNESYSSKFNSIVSFFKSWMKNKYPNVYVSYNDYYVLPDWSGGGMLITLQWRGKEPDEREVINAIENKFYGVSASRTWGSWDHQISVNVDEKACNESLNEGADPKLLSKVSKDIEKAKNKLKGKKPRENFGQDEVRKLRDKYFEYRYGSNSQVFDLINQFDDWCSTYVGESLTEDIEKATIETEDQVIEVSTEEKEPVEEETAETEEEVVAPLSDEDIAEIETNTDEAEEETPEEEQPEEEIPEEEFPEDEEEFEFDEVQEESFNRLMGNYLKETYSNIKSFELKDVKSNKTKLKLEGKIKFNSGKEKDTTFIFERIANKDSIAKDKARYIGLNETFTNKKNAYVLRVSRNNNTLVAESLRYSYPAKSSKLNEDVKLVKGFVR